MTTIGEGRWRRIDELFHEAVQLDASERQALLRSAAADESSIVREVRLLLQGHERDASFLDRPAHGGASRLLELDLSGDPHDPVGSRLGPWRITRLLAAGGMGAVYLAVRDDDAFQKQVAIKLIRRGWAGGTGARQDELIRRFQIERQALANLDHPSIARLLDGGTSPDGRPYLVMEYVEGLHIDAYCDARQLSVRGRIELLCDVCDAVQHAHQRAVIHRDLKPGNILVTPEGAPKLLDFGLAKLVDSHREAAAHQLTIGEEFMGTITWAAPEQLTDVGGAPDSRSDVYALGVILYRLLAGRHPYDTTGPMTDVLRRITHDPVPPPSSVNPRLNGEVDSIVLKAIAKEPARRYESAGDLRADLQRYLRGEPILARADSRGYMLRKTVRRYRVPLAAAAGFMLLVGIAAVVATVQAARLAEQKSVLARTLRVGNIERGRALAASGSMVLAEQILWAEHLSDAHDRGGDGGLSRWALWELYLNHPSLRAIPIDLDRAVAASWSGDARWLAIAGVDGDVSILDAASGAVHRRLPAARRSFPRLGFRPGDSSLLIANRGGDAGLYDVESDRWLYRMDFHGPVDSIAWAPDGRRLAVATADAVAICDAATGARLATSALPGRQVRSLAWSPDGRLLAAGCGDGHFALLDGDSGAVKVLRAGTDKPCCAVRFSPDGRLLAVTFDATSVAVFDVATQRITAYLDDAAGQVRAICFHPERRGPYWMAAAGDDNIVRIWEVPADGASGRVIRVFHGHDAPVRAIQFSNDGELLLSAAGGPPLRIWEVTEQACRTEWADAGSVLDVQCTPDGRHVISVGGGGGDGAVRVRDAASGQVTRTFAGHVDVVSTIAVDPRGQGLVSAGHDGMVMRWDLDAPDDAPRWAVRVCDCSVNAVSWSPDGRVLAEAGDDGVVRLLDGVSGAELASFDLACDRIPSMRFSPDGRYIAAAVIPRNSIVLIEPATGQRVEFSAHEQHIRVVRFSPDGSILASGGDDLAIRLWSMRDGSFGECLATLTGERHDIFALAFSHDGSLLASGGRGGGIRLWCPSTGRNLLAMPGHADMVFGLTFSVDGQRLFSASRDNSIGVWDLAYYDRHIEGNRAAVQR